MAKKQPVRRRAEDDPRWTSHVAPAPGELKIVQAFVNTAVRRTRTEELSSPQALGRWLARWRLIPEDTEPTAEDFERAVEVREGVRALLRGNNGVALDQKAVARLDRAAADVPLRLRVDGEGVAYLAASSTHGVALGRLLGIFAAARFEDSWPRFKACADPPAARPSTTPPRTFPAGGARSAAAIGSPLEPRAAAGAPSERVGAIGAGTCQEPDRPASRACFSHQELNRFVP